MGINEVKTASLFKNGRNQALRLPVEFTLDADEVFIEKRDGQLIITPKPKSWSDYFDQGLSLSEDFPDQIEDLVLQKREDL